LLKNLAAALLLIAFLPSILTPGTVAAQGIVSDKEPLAAYCLGVVKTWDRQLNCSQADLKCERIVGSAIQENADRLTRLTSYLATKGIADPNAEDTGKREAERCDPVPALMSCPVCREQGQDGTCEACIDANLSDVCRRANRCHG
jgi:hypothetical protein